MYLWAGVGFTAMGGQTADFLQRASLQNVKLRNIRPLVGGVCAQCTAKKYRSIHKLAKSCRVRLHITQKYGAYFKLRTIFIHRGIWVALFLMLFLFRAQQNLIWQVDYSHVTPGQQARIESLLWQFCNIAPGAYYSETLLAKGESVLLSYDEEFSWVSLNFSGGRLSVEVNAAEAVPNIELGTDADITASTAGKVTSVNVKHGTAAVTVGDEVSIGQVLIASSRLKHDQETLIYEPTAGEVLATFETTYTAKVDLLQQVIQPSAPITIKSNYQIFIFGQVVSIPACFDSFVSNHVTASEPTVSTDLSSTSTRIIPFTFFGFCFPATIYEENTIYYQKAQVIYSDEEALALAKLSCLNQLYAAYPDAQILQEKQENVLFANQLEVQVTYQIIADICNLSE